MTGLIHFLRAARTCSVLLCAAVLAASVAHADYLPFDGAAVAPNIAEISISPGGVTVKLEIYVGDLPVFEDLIPDTASSDETVAAAALAAGLAEFSEAGLAVRRNDGSALPASLRLLEPRKRIDRTTALSGTRDPVTGRVFPAPPDDKRVLFAELFYDFEGRKPQAITLAPPADQGGLPRAIIGMIVYDRGVPVTRFRFMSKPARLDIDWNDPWYSKFDNPNLSRHHPSGAMTFIYVEPREIRHETLIRVRDIDGWLGLGLLSGDVLAPEDQNEIKAAALAFLSKRNAVMIDNTQAASESGRAEILKIDDAGFQIIENRPVTADAAFVGTILSFPRETLPDSVEVTWDLFDQRLTKIPASIFDPAGLFLSGATPEDPIVKWQNHLLTYESPQVFPVPVGSSGMFQVPVLSLLAGFGALAATALAIRSRGPLRIGGLVTAAAGVTAAVVSPDIATLNIRNPAVRTPDAAAATNAFAELVGAVSVAQLEVTAEARQQQLLPVVTRRSLPEVGPELERALAVRIPGGGIASVSAIKNLSLQDISPLPSGFGFRALAEWSSEAIAGHWGHSHRRYVNYRALIEVKAEKGQWKLDGITVIEARTPNA